MSSPDITLTAGDVSSAPDDGRGKHINLPPPPPGMSKSAWKKQLKQEALVAARAARRDAEKAAKAASRALAAPAGVELTAEQRTSFHGAQKKRCWLLCHPSPGSLCVLVSVLLREQRAKKVVEDKLALVAKYRTGVRVVMDCDFFELMTLRERRSTLLQLTYAPALAVPSLDFFAERLLSPCSPLPLTAGCTAATDTPPNPSSVSLKWWIGSPVHRLA